MTETPTDPIEIVLSDGTTRHLRYSLGSMRRLKKKFGVSMLTKESLASLDEDKLADLLYEGLVDKEGMSLDEMSDLIDSRRLKSYVDAFGLAWSGSVPEVPEKNATSQTTVQ